MRRFFIVLVVLAKICPLYSQTTEQPVDICIDCLGDVTYLRDFQVELEASEPGLPGRAAGILSLVKRL